MPYGTNYGPGYDNQPSAYSANPVSTTNVPAYGGGGAQTSPGGGADGGGTHSAQGQQGGGGGGMGAGGWMALFQMVGDKLEGRRAAQAAKEASLSDIPEDPAYMVPFLREMGIEGQMLKDSKLGARPTAEASAMGHRAATARGLSGPLAASVQAEAVGNAQSNYDRWRQSALMAHRQSYMQRVQQYMQAVQQYRQKKRAAGYAHREASIANIPVGPIGQAMYRTGLDNGGQPLGTGYKDTKQGIEASAQYTPYTAYSY